MNYLELCQKVARESGTISGVSPSTVISQTGRLLKVVNWTADAWTWVQNEHIAWRWMRSRFSWDCSIGTRRYTPAAVNLTDFGRWLTDDLCRSSLDAISYYPVTLYLTATGVSDEGAIREIDYSLWRHRYDRGTQDNARPVSYAISPANEFCLGGSPDYIYTVQGEYFIAPVLLAANADTPAMPSQFHDAIVWRALELLAEFDEAPLAIAAARYKRLSVMAALENSQLDTIEITCGTLA